MGLGLHVVVSLVIVSWSGLVNVRVRHVLSEEVTSSSTTRPHPGWNVATLTPNPDGNVTTLTRHPHPGGNVTTLTPQPGGNGTNLMPRLHPGGDVATLTPRPGGNVTTLTPHPHPGVDVTTLEPHPHSHPTRGKNFSGTCQSIDVRNGVEYLVQLRGCRVVEGSVQIVLIDHANETDYDDFSFPELREITHYLLVYRVNGLRSIGQLFPSLTLIRGNTVFVNYALAVYENFQLQEMGLKSLTEITRGAVRIEKNPNLCFLNTIDWELIARWDAANNYISHNKPPADCPGPSVCQEAGCPQALCWTRYDCQLQAKETYKDCHPECLGGCSGSGPAACHACRKYLSRGECVSTCPENTYLLLNRKCVTKDHCLSLVDQLSEGSKSLHFVVFNGTCVQSCPPGYDLKRDKKSCEKCAEAKCRKVCPSHNIESVADAQHLRGCTFINGSIEIAIKHGKHEVLAEELEESLKSVEEIRGYLKITRCFPLMNLNFFRYLKIIHGKEDIESNKTLKYSLIVVDNKNLQELWNFTENGGLRILNGGIFFHYNPKLCFYHIELLKSITGVKNISDFEVDPKSNGDKFACRKTVVNMTFTEVTSTSVIINIFLPNKTSPRPNLQRFVLYYTEALGSNMSFFEETDECDGDAWKVRDILTEGDENPVSDIQTFLKPYTRYAFYVKTYTVSSIGGHSAIHYVTTLPSRPSKVTVTSYFSNSSSSIVLQWEPPHHPNGNVSQYIVTGYRHEENQTLINLRDYCQHPMVEEEEEVLPPEFLTRVKTENKSCCPENQISYYSKGKFGVLCDNYHYRELSFEPDYSDEMFNCDKYFYNGNERPNHFETAVRYPHKKSNFCDINNQLKNCSNLNKKIKKALPKHKLKVSFFKIVNDTTYVTIGNLSHFTQFTVSVRACRERYQNRSSDNYQLRCSKSEIVTLRTLKNPEADVIPSNKVSHEILEENRKNALEIRWAEPSDPNGMVLAFEIEHKRSDLENAKSSVDCITYLDYMRNGNVYVLRGLVPGQYTYRMRTVSLAGLGAFTDHFQFEIQKETLKYYYKLLSISLSIIIIITICGTYYVVFLRKRSLTDLDKLLANAYTENVLTPPPYVEDAWEIPRENVKIHEEVGQGSFGKVYRGTLFPDKVECAIKSVTDTSLVHSRAFLNETSIMKHATEAHHIVQLLGVVSKGIPPLIVMELMALGDLKTYLRSSRELPFSSSTFFKMSLQIADAMLFMEKNKFVHRDLAARNCMVSSDLTVKVGDFGLTRVVYSTDYYRQGEKTMLPIRWMAPESLRDGLFSSRSDVWSYGVVLWEIATFAELPFQGLSNEDVLHRVLKGLTLSLPISCPKVLQTVILQCWMKDPSCRPSFLQLLTQLERYTDDVFKRLSYYHTTVLKIQSNIGLRGHQPQVRLIY